MTPNPTGVDNTPDATPSGGVPRGRGGLIVPAVLAVASTLTVIGIVTMEVPATAKSPGPTFFPILLAVVGYLLAVGLTVHYLRHPDPIAAEDEHRTYTDWRAVAWLVGGVAVFAVLLDVLGWILAAALMFWCVTRAFGGKRPLFDISVALLVSSAVFVVFGVGLDLALPSGLLGGL